MEERFPFSSDYSSHFRSGEFLTEFMSHIHSYRIVDIILVRTILVSVGRLCDKRKIISVFTKIIHLPSKSFFWLFPYPTVAFVSQVLFNSSLVCKSSTYFFSPELIPVNSSSFDFLSYTFNLLIKSAGRFSSAVFYLRRKSFAIYIDFTDGLSVVCQRIIFLIIYQSGNTLH